MQVLAAPVDEEEEEDEEHQAQPMEADNEEEVFYDAE